MNIAQLKPKQDAAQAAPAEHPALAWIKAHKGKLAIAAVLIVGLVAWYRLESRQEGGEGGGE